MSKKDNKAYKLTTAIWVLSCNDKPTQMTYKGIIERIDNVSLDEIRSIVSNFPELFQLQIPKKQLEDWKSQMKGGCNRPKWIAQSNSDDTIENLELDDVFRNRFRNSIDAEVVDNSILEWGINYIHEFYEKKERQAEKIWQRLSSFILPLISVLVVAFSAYTVSQNEKQKIEIEKLKTEINRMEFKSELIYPSYNKLVDCIGKSMLYGFFENYEYRNKELKNARIELYKLMPFVNEDKFDPIKQIFTDYHVLMIKNDSLQNLTDNQKEEIFEKYGELTNELWKAINNEIKVVDNEK